MTNSNTSSEPLSLEKRMIIGGAIGLAVLGFFVIGAGSGLPEWGKYWMIQPLLVGPFAGAVGGACNYYIMRFRVFVGVSRPLAFTISSVIFIFGMWMGIVLGLHGTMWN